MKRVPRDLANDRLRQQQLQRGRGIFTNMSSPGISKSRGQHSVLVGGVEPCLSLGWHIVALGFPAFVPNHVSVQLWSANSKTSWSDL